MQRGQERLAAAADDDEEICWPLTTSAQRPGRAMLRPRRSLHLLRPECTAAHAPTAELS